MNAEPAIPQPQTEPGRASAEDGYVVLDGPAMIAVTMTASAANRTAENLITAALLAESQIAEKRRHDG